MGRVCAAVNCTSRQKKDSGVSFHEFPHKRPEVLKKWLQNVRREKWFPREKSSFLCSKHFLPDCFEGGRQTLRRLRDDAIPTVFDYTVKTRKRKLSALAHVKRLATSSANVITSSVERNRSQKSASKGKPQRKTNERPVQLPTTRNDRRSLRNIENRPTPLRKSRLFHSKKQINRHIGHEREEEREGRDRKTRVSVGANTKRFSVLRATKGETTQADGAPHQATTAGFQTITIVPTITSGNGEVSYRLIVQDCDDDDTIATETSNSKAAQRLPSNGKGYKDDSLMMKCTYCRYVTQKRYLLSRHLRAHLELHPHQCDQCPLSFKTLLALQNHINTHRGVRPFRCRGCDDRFTTSGELVTHMQNCREKGRDVFLGSKVRGCRASEVPYFCLLCSFIGSDAQSLKRHLVLHSEEKQFECNVCDARFNNRELLEAHRSMHFLS